MKTNNTKPGHGATPSAADLQLRDKRRAMRKKCENMATFGLLLLCAAMIAPFASAGKPEFLKIFSWVYAAGALTYTVARMVNVSDPAESVRLKRLRRMEFWAGIAFCIASGFWFYTLSRLGDMAGVLAVMKNTVLFTVVGAMLQIIASWLIVSRMKKEHIPS